MEDHIRSRKLRDAVVNENDPRKLAEVVRELENLVSRKPQEVEAKTPPSPQEKPPNSPPFHQKW